MNPRPSYERFVLSVGTLLAGPLPGPPAQNEMAPPHRTTEDGMNIRADSCREAGVTALFYPPSGGETDPSLLLTVRPESMQQHAGQIAFPGGRREEGESLLEAALRETEEEVAILPGDIRLLGELTPLYIPPSDFCVYPFVGALSEEPDLAVTSDEVASLFGFPVRDLTDASIRSVTVRGLKGRQVEVPCFDFDGKCIWGATAMMLAELAVVVEAALVG